jgi:hypothetical protein
MGVLFKPTDVNIALEEDDFNELKSRVYSQFGWPTVAVEISDDNFKYILKRTIMYLNTYSPKLDYIAKSITPYITDYEILEYEQVNAVLDVYVSAEYLIGLGMPIQSFLAVPMSLSASHNTQHLENYISMFTAYDMTKRMFGTQPIAELVPPNIVRLNPAPYTSTIFKFAITVDHDANLGSLSEYEINWMTRFCQAGVGKVLGQIRRKYDGVQLPVGSLSGSGSTIYNESMELEKELLEELKLRHKFPQTFIVVG